MFDVCVVCMLCFMLFCVGIDFLNLTVTPITSISVTVKERGFTLIIMYQKSFEICVC